MYAIIIIPVLLVGGTEMQTLQQIRVLVDGGYRVTLCCFYEYDERMRAEMEKTGATVVFFGENPSSGLWSLLQHLVIFFWQERPDIVHVQYIAPGFIPVLAARLAGVRTVFATVHQPGRTYGWKAHLLLRTASRLCTAFFCNSLAVEQSWFGDAAPFDRQRITSRRHWTIYNAVNVEKIASLAASDDRSSLHSQLGLGAGPVIGCVGRLRHEKGQAVLLDSMSVVIREFPVATLLMVGDGPDRTRLEQRAKNLGIANNVIWLGAKDTDDVFRLLGVMDVVVVPSKYEGFGLVAAEAMAASVPVVATCVDGLKEVVEDGISGYLVAFGDSKGLATKIVEFLRDPDKARRFGRSGNLRVKEYYSYEKYKNRILSLYSSYIK